MVTRQQLDRLTARIEALAGRFVPPQPPLEVWIVEGDRAWQRSQDRSDAISYGELHARPTGRTVWPNRIELRLVHADNGAPAGCCQPGGACYALHGPIGGPGQ